MGMVSRNDQQMTGINRKRIPDAVTIGARKGDALRIDRTQRAIMVIHRTNPSSPEDRC